MAEMGYCPSGRLFEAAACATPIVSDYWPGLEQFFEPGREILVVSNAHEVEDALSLDHEQLRHIGEAARQRVLAEHTADHRGGELLSLLEVAA
jgi:spore maturation protein CgeB